MDSSTLYITSVVLMWISFGFLMIRPVFALRNAVIEPEEVASLRTFLRSVERFFIILSSFQSLVVFVLYPGDTVMLTTKGFVNLLIAAFMLWTTHLVISHIRLLEIDTALSRAQKTPT